MLEAVNSVLSNSSYTRVVAQQQSASNSFAANPNKIQEASLEAPYISKYVKVETNFKGAILQIRDSGSGDVIRQIPTESQLEAYRRADTSIAIRKSDIEAKFVLTEQEAARPSQTSAPAASQQSISFTPSLQVSQAATLQQSVVDLSVDTSA